MTCYLPTWLNMKTSSLNNIRFEQQEEFGQNPTKIVVENVDDIESDRETNFMKI